MYHTSWSAKSLGNKFGLNVLKMVEWCSEAKLLTNSKMSTKVYSWWTNYCHIINSISSLNNASSAIIAIFSSFWSSYVNLKVWDPCKSQDFFLLSFQTSRLGPWCFRGWKVWSILSCNYFISQNIPLNWSNNLLLCSFVPCLIHDWITRFVSCLKTTCMRLVNWTRMCTISWIGYSIYMIVDNFFTPWHD